MTYVPLTNGKDNQENMYRAAFTNKNFSSQIYAGIFNTLKANKVSSRNFTLPRLPVPSLQQTLEKYLRTVRPHVNDKEFNATKSLIEKFSSPEGLGTKLQKLLQEKAASSENWLSDWWLNAAYLDFRLPVVVHSSPGLVFPFATFKNEMEMLEFTAKLISGAVAYKNLIENNEIPVDKMGKDPLDMNQYNKIFGTCRVPGLKRDGIEFNRNSNHIAVVHNNQFFKLIVVDENNNPLSINQLTEQLSKIKAASSEEDKFPVGILTSEHRDNWGKAYQSLIKSEKNCNSAGEIQKSLFLVCLDKPMELPRGKNKQTIAGELLIHGCGSEFNGGNRWYDKTVQFVVNPNGINGLTYEHSPSEGQPIAVMTDYIVNYIKDGTACNIKDSPQQMCTPEKLEFELNEDVRQAICVAKDNLDKLTEDLDMDCTPFKCFGKDFVKSQKLSPDSFIQIAMQFAFFRIHNIPGAHYESAATRKYIHGRTETIRSCSIESVDFACAMLNPRASDGDKIAALRKAIDGHKKYTIEAINGFGVDRHLLGLKLMALEKNLEISPLYSDASYVKSAHMRVSSSQVATNCEGFMCYGPLVPDGYACCYNPRKNDILMGVSAFVSHPDTDASRFREAMEDSLLDMHNLLAKNQQAKL